VTVLALCLQQQKAWLGVGLVGAFSVGLALVLVAVGIAAAWGLEAGASSGNPRVAALIRHAPLASGLVLLAVGLAMLRAGAAALTT
jgi:nickel/cobalt exporter